MKKVSNGVTDRRTVIGKHVFSNWTTISESTVDLCGSDSKVTNKLVLGRGAPFQPFS